MRTFGLLAGVMLTCGTPVYGESRSFVAPQVQIVNNSSLDFKTVLKKYDEAYAQCLADTTATTSKAAFIACLNRKLTPFKLKVE